MEKKEVNGIVDVALFESKETETKKETEEVDSEPDNGFKLIGLEKEKKALSTAVKHSFPTLLVGETGVGKTYMIQSVARKLGKTVIRVSLNGEIGINELLGKWLVKEGSTYWQDGVLIDAMRRGHWVIMDEINAALPEILFCLNALLDDSRSIVVAEKDGEKVQPVEDFRFFATMNPPDEYAGTKEMNKALLSRFPMVLYMTEYEPETELAIVKYQSKVNDVIGRIMVDAANAVRSLKGGKKIWYTCSTRDVVNWGRLSKSKDHSLEESFELAILNKASVEERKDIVRAIKSAVSVSINWKDSADIIRRKLTDDLAIDVKKLEAKRTSLRRVVKELQVTVDSITEEVEK